MKTKRISCMKLSTVLSEYGIVITASTLRQCCEAYGRDIRCYFNAKTYNDRLSLETFLGNKGILFHPEYWPGSSCLEISVTYFKAWHWNE